jgi:hypothetical protein
VRKDVAIFGHFLRELSFAMNRAVSPRLSVIVASMRPGDDLPSALRDLAHGGPTSGVEVIFAERVSDAASWVCLVDADGVVQIGVPDAASLPQLLGMALEHSRGEIIALTDTRCEVDHRWAAALLRAHESAHPVIGGAVEPGALRRLVDWAAYLTDYNQFMLPLNEGSAAELPGNNISIKRWALAHGREFVNGEFWKSYWCRQLQAEGLELHLTPEVVVHYHCAYDFWPFLIRRFHHGRCFAGMRLRQIRGFRRVAYLAGAPALPLLLLARTVRAVLPKRRCIGKLALAMPMIYLGMVSWAVGELAGYLCGPGESCHYVR